MLLSRYMRLLEGHSQARQAESYGVGPKRSRRFSRHTLDRWCLRQVLRESVRALATTKLRQKGDCSLILQGMIVRRFALAAPHDPTSASKDGVTHRSASLDYRV